MARLDETSLGMYFCLDVCIILEILHAISRLSRPL